MRRVLRRFWALASLDFSGSALALLFALALLALGKMGPLFLFLLFFAVSSFFTHYGAELKGRHSPRKWQNVLANGAFALLAALANSNELFFGALCAVFADKLAGEIGQTSQEKPRLITKPSVRVVRGTDGGVTLLGEGTSIATGAFFGVASFFVLGGHSFAQYLVTGALVGFFGSNFDSILGAEVESRGLLSKHGVNFLASVFGGIVSVLVFGMLN